MAGRRRGPASTARHRRCMLRAVGLLNSLPLPTPAGPKWRTPRGRADGRSSESMARLGPLWGPLLGLAAVDSTPWSQFIGLRREIAEESHEKGYRPSPVRDWRRYGGGARRRKPSAIAKWASQIPHRLGGRAGFDGPFGARKKRAADQFRPLLCRGSHAVRRHASRYYGARGGRTRHWTAGVFVIRPCHPECAYG